MKVPVLFIIFNRPQLVEETFGPIRKYKPQQLYIAADGPRTEKKGEKALCEETRNKVLSMIDWDCEVHTLFRPENRGCGRGPSEAISWMFETEEYGIILEDDCYPASDFFLYCEELLPLYKYENAVMQLNGLNPVAIRKEGDTYSFSHYPKIWGWATWKRAWNYFDFNMDYWPRYRKNWAFMKDFSILEGLIHRRVWNKYYKELRVSPRPRAWDLQWSIAVFKNKGLCIVPEVNLVENIGIGEDATNCKYDTGVVFRKFGKLTFPLKHPDVVSLTPETNSCDSRFYMDRRMKSLKYKIKRFF